MLSHPQLMARIEQYSFDNPDLPTPDFGFADRLCVETGWAKPFAERAIREYRRFVYLAVTGDRPVTPSREVDAVWHLHLTYTRSYWERLRAILPRDLHHEPTPGGQTAAAVYRSQYAGAKARYLAEFGETPPETFWPPEEERFQRDMRKMRGVNSQEPGRQIGKFTVIGAAAAAVAAPAFAADALSGETVTALVIGVGMFVLLGGIVFLSRIGGSATPNNKKKDKGGDSGSVYFGGEGGSSGGKGGKGDANGGEGGGEGGGDGGGGGCGGGCGGGS